MSTTLAKDVRNQCSVMRDSSAETSQELLDHHRCQPPPDRWSKTNRGWEPSAGCQSQPKITNEVTYRKCVNTLLVIDKLTEFHLLLALKPCSSDQPTLCVTS